MVAQFPPRSSRVLIVIDDGINEQDEGVEVSLRTVRETMVSALKEAIALAPIASATVEVLTLLQLQDFLSLPNTASTFMTGDTIWCPLTWIPHTIEFPDQDLFKTCSNVSLLRQWVKQELGYATGESQSLYLPVVLTAKGPLYGEVIGIDGEIRRWGDGEMGGLNTTYHQPVDLPDDQRQPLYHLAYQLLQFLSAPPAVYLVQFGFEGRDIVFDRVLPFPDAPAIASLGVQNPDLFTCHWHCLTRQPITELTIIPSVE
ncbi:MAG TPA: hypothetical protein DCY91_01805 [Cyanobacteria bacterium UBA11370]|nr:hypothetical protein [Cyanobacteria bacterium UBA11370]